MRQFVGSWIVCAVLMVGAGATARGQAVASSPAPQGTPPPSPSPAIPAIPAIPDVPAGGVTAVPTGSAPVAQPAAGVAPPVQGRAFTGSTGLIFNAVRAERVADFERALAYFVAALEKSTDAGVRAQAKGWRIMKAAEPGPNNTVLYVFLIDPTVPKADYSLGPILAEAYPDPAELQQIWKLYTSAVTSGGSLLNLSPLTLPKPTGPLTIPAPPAAGTSKTPAAGAPATPAAGTSKTPATGAPTTPAGTAPVAPATPSRQAPPLPR